MCAENSSKRGAIIAYLTKNIIMIFSNLAIERDCSNLRKYKL